MPLTGLIPEAANTIIQPLMSHLTNVKNRKFTREMYNRQRHDALADWEMQNVYNSPREQMKRFQEAGLNPKLIYGQTNEMPAVRSSDGAAGGARAPEMNLFQGYDLAAKSAQVDLVAKQMELMEQEANLKKATTYATVAGTGKTEAEIKRILFDLGIDVETRGTTLAMRGADLEQKRVAIAKGSKEIDNLSNEIDFRRDENARRWIMQQPTFQKAVEEVKNLQVARMKMRSEMLSNYYERQKMQQEILNMDVQYNNLKKDGKIKDWEIELNKKGLKPGDPGWWRVIGEAFDRMRPSKGKFDPKTSDLPNRK